MPRYLVTSSTRLQSLQEEDFPQPIAFLVPDVLDITHLNAIFVLETIATPPVTIISKVSTDNSELQKEGQLLTVLFEAADTANKAGIYHWYLKVYDAEESITVAFGNIQINRMN